MDLTVTLPMDLRALGRSDPLSFRSVLFLLVESPLVAPGAAGSPTMIGSSVDMTTLCPWAFPRQSGWGREGNGVRRELGLVNIWRLVHS